ncbi:hypothetical protein VTN96DRAFT_5396 [Rasamsonia emersonii]
MDVTVQRTNTGRCWGGSTDVELAIRPLNNNNSSTTDLSSERPADVEDNFVSVFFSRVYLRYPFMDKISFYEADNQRRLSSQDAQPDKTYLFIIYMIQAIELGFPSFIKTCLGVRIRRHIVGDHEIDVRLPVNIDDDVKDPERIRPLQQIQDSPEVSTDFISITTLSSFIHICHLRRLESKIHHQLYAADLGICFADGSHDHVIDNLKAELDVWQERIPDYNAAKNLDPYDYSIYHTPEFFKIQHSKALGWILLATHSIFTAGLTLLYCLWANRENVNVYLTLFDDIRSCSTVLFVVAERWPTVRRFRDVFKVLARKMFQIVSHNHARQTGPAPTAIDSEE